MGRRCGLLGRGSRRRPAASSRRIRVHWSDEDCALLRAEVGDPGSQATFEAYMFLLAVRHFVTAGLRGRVTVVGDALGVWYSLVKLASRSTVVNEIAKELALYLAPLGHEVRGIHVWSELNGVADALSRVASGAAMPPQVQGVEHQALAARDLRAWKCLGAQRPGKVGLVIRVAGDRSLPPSV